MRSIVAARGFSLLAKRVPLFVPKLVHLSEYTSPAWHRFLKSPLSLKKPEIKVGSQVHSTVQALLLDC